jgi:hypothetical protein
MIGRNIPRMKAPTKILLSLLLLAATVVLFLATRPSAPPAPEAPPSAPSDIIPPGIVVTESAAGGSDTPSLNVPGDTLLLGYAAPGGSAQQDLAQLSRVLANFILTHKQANDRPLSANEEWSSTLRGKRPGAGAWVSETSPLFDAEKRLIDRWQSPLHFHALGRNQWQIRSPGPDKTLFTADDLTEEIR